MSYCFKCHRTHDMYYSCPSINPADVINIMGHEYAQSRGFGLAHDWDEQIEKLRKFLDEPVGSADRR